MERSKPKFTLKTEWFALLMIIIIIGIAVWAYPQLDGPVPSHWNAAGQVDGYSTPLGHALGMPAMFIGIYLLLLALPFIEPRRQHFLQSWGFYAVIKNFLLGFFALIYAVSTWGGLVGEQIPMGTIVPLAVGLLFIILGNYMTQIKSNFFMGIRTPWTLSSEDNWKKTHRLGAYTFVIGGLLFFATPFLSVPLNFYIPMIGIIIAGLLPVLMSFVWFLKDKR
ncbi:MAG: SdpI family protein [Patescibacteria group bacterium]|nr:SdpI family protein [Patescibacteria group bacterium]